MTDMNLYAVIAITILGGTGLAVLLFGALFTIAGAFGHGRIFWGIICILSLPICFAFCFVYCFLFPEETKYQRKYLLTAVGLLLLTFIAYLFL